MKKILFVLSLALGFNNLSFAQELETTIDSLSYGMGVLVASSLKNQGAKEVNGAIVGKAIEQVFNNEKTIMNQAEASMFLNTYFQKQAKVASADRIKEGKDFLAANAKKEGVITLPSGLQYIVLKEGKGEKPSATSTVSTHYHGTLIDGRVFDSSVERGSPASFPVNRVIKGWTEALQLMSVGSKWKIFCPPNLAYGESAKSELIQPYTTLIFEVELLSIEQ